MGVGDLNKFLKEKIPHAFQTVNSADLNGRKIASDAPIFIKKHASTLHKNMLYELKSPTDEYSRDEFEFRLKLNILIALMKLLKNGTLPVKIFDGPQRPEKAECSAKRMEEKMKVRAKISAAYLEYISKHPLERTREDDIKLLKLREQDFLSGRPLTKEEYDSSVNNYRNLMIIKELVEYIGIPTFTAQHDAEKLCASLSMEGKVFGVLSTDTDNYVCGTKITISKIYPNGTMDIVILDYILQFFQEDFQCNPVQAVQVFTDFCIMCGCDFNHNIAGIATKTSHKLLKQYGNIDNIGCIKDISCLKHFRCREIFAPEPSRIFEDKLQLNTEKFVRGMNDLLIYFQSEILKSSYSLVNMSFFVKKVILFEGGI